MNILLAPAARGRVLAIAVCIVAAACSNPAPPAHVEAAPIAPAAASTAPMDHEMDTAMDPNAPMAMASAEASGRFGNGQPVSVTLHVRDMMSGKAMGEDSFLVAHTEKVHVLGIDPSLGDYSHSHAMPGKTAGDWQFEFTPKFDRPYHLWLDVTPVGGPQQFVLVTVNDKAATVPVEKVPALSADTGEIHATLRFEAPLVVGRPAQGILELTRGGKPLAALEPVMGAYAHIVGISEDWTTIAHVHPMGTEPTQASDRGGPSIEFHLEPTHAGFLKLFAQIRLDGRDVFLPFGVTVAQAPGKSLAP
jgi:hypothetical protein